MSSTLSSLATRFLSLMGVGDDEQPQPEPQPTAPKTEAAFDAAMHEAMAAAEVARGLVVVNDRAAAAAALMEDKLVEAIDAAKEQDFDAGVAALAVASAQADIVADERAKMRTAFVAREEGLTARLAGITLRLDKITVPGAAVAQASTEASEAGAASTQAGEADLEDWPAALATLDELEKALDDLAAAVMTEAGSRSAAFGVRFAAKKNLASAGSAAIKARTAYLAQQKKLDAAVGKDGLAALELCAAAELALSDFEGKAAPSATSKSRMASDTLVAVTALSDSELGQKSMTDKATLAFDLCADGRPRSGPALAQLCRLYRASPPDAAFIAKREDERGKIAEKVAKIEGLKKVFGTNGRVNAAEWAKVIADPAKVRALLQEVSDAQLAVLGLPPVAVTTFDEPKVGTSVNMGGCKWTAGPPTIDLNSNKAAVSDANEALISILHETFHAQQDILIKKLMAGELGPDDPIYPQVLMFAANQPGVGYLPPAVSQEDYEAQPVEIDAEAQGTATKNAVLLAMKGKSFWPWG